MFLQTSLYYPHIHNDLYFVCQTFLSLFYELSAQFTTHVEAIKTKGFHTASIKYQYPPSTMWSVSHGMFIQCWASLSAIDDFDQAILIDYIILWQLACSAESWRSWGLLWASMPVSILEPQQYTSTSGHVHTHSLYREWWSTHLGGEGWRH